MSAVSAVNDQLIGMANIFVDPGATVKRVVQHKNSWVLPLVIISLITIVVSLWQIPLAMRIMEQNPPGGMTAEQFQQRAGMISTMQKVGVFFTPVIVAIIALIQAWLISVTCSIMGLRAKVRDVFSLIMYASLIPTLGVIAGFLVVRAKANEIQSLDELRPAFGLDIFIHEGVSKPVQAILSYFSIFTIWYIVVLSIGVARLAEAPVSKGFIATIPAWLLSLLFFVGAASLRG
jgi:hypothetical protein